MHGYSMVTARMGDEKKRAGARVLAREGMNASQAINRLYDRIIKEGSARFLDGSTPAQEARTWENAARFVDSLSAPRASRFDSMTKAEIRAERLRARGLM